MISAYPGTPWGGFAFHTTTDGSVGVGTDYWSTNGRITTGPGFLLAGQWQHIVFTFDRGTGTLYRNGTLISSLTGMAGPGFAWQGLRIGNGGSHDFGGSIADFRVYYRALSAAEAQVLAQCPLGMALPPNAPSADLNRNWTVERTYDGSGNDAGNILSESKQFTDGLGRATQAQARSRANPHVFASETIYSTGGQPVVQTLAAPINNQSFAYKEQFAAFNRAPAGSAADVHNYDATNFEGAKAGSPDGLNVHTPGTLGYYYSTENQLEPLTPATDYPFSLTEPSEGPLGGIRRAAAPGEAFRMGEGHEAKGREVPLLSEFDHYMRLRHYFVSGSNSQVSLQDQGSKSIQVDGDGRESIVVANKEGQPLVSCLTGTQYPPIAVTGYISTDPTNAYSAPLFRDIHIPATGEHRLDFTVAGTVRVINLNGGASVSLTSGSGYADSLDVVVAASSGNTLRTSVYLLPGFYRLVSRPSLTNNVAEQTQRFTYNAEYGNFSYTYYDDAGRVVASVAPNGLGGNITLRNPGFEQDPNGAQTISGWQNEYSNPADATYSETGNAHSGNVYGVHWSPGGHDAYTYQLVTGLPNGLYTARAWVKNSGITQNWPIQAAALLIKEYDASNNQYRMSADIPVTSGGDWVQVEVPNIAVTNGQCKVGLWSISGQGDWIKFDDVELIRQQNDDLPGFVTRNTYDTSSRLLATESAEAGRTEYVYARDGRIRFSQSALQRPNAQRTTERFSYSNYDEQGRVVESGEYTSAVGSGLTFQSPVTSAVLQAENSTDSGGGTQTGSTTVGASTVTYLGNFNQRGAYLGFNVNVLTSGTYSVRIRYAAGDPAFASRTMPLYLRNSQTSGYLYHATFPSTGAWNQWDTQTLELPLAQGDNRILFQQDRSNSDPLHEGYVNFDYLEVVSETVPTSTSILNVLEERAPTNSLLAANCSQRNFVTYDEAVTVANRTQEFTIGAVSKTQNDHVTTWYSYDEQGRVTWVVQDIAGLGTKTLDYTYDPAGNVLEVAYQHGQPDAFHHYYEYDGAQRLFQVFTSADGAVRTLQATYFYYLHGPLKRVELADGLQGMDYTYTLQGWLKSINHVNQALDPGGDSPAANGVPKDLFSLTLDYFTGDYQSRAQAAINPSGLSSTSNPFRYDGTIRAATWRTAASPDRHQMVYQYDAKSQLAESTHGLLNITGPTYQFQPNQAFKEGGLAYDPNGNIQSLKRTNKDGLVTDNFSYQYTPGTNRLSTVHGGGSPTGTPVLDYAYDELGQMTREREGTQDRYLRYDVTGKVTGVYKSTSSQYAIVTFTYDDKGFRSSKVNYDENGDVTNTTTYVRDIAGNILSVYESNYANRYTPTRIEVPLYGASRVGVLTHIDDGSATGYDDARYELNDHLGNARVVFHRPTTTTVTRRLELSEPQNNTAFTDENTYRTATASAHSPDYVARLDGRTAPAPMTRTLTLVQGDTVTFSAWSLIRPDFSNRAAPGPVKRLLARLRPLLLLGAATPPAQLIAEGPQPGTNTTATRWWGRAAAGVGLTLGGTAPALLRGATSLSQAWIKYRLVYEDGTVDEHTEYVPLDPTWQTTRVAVRARQGGTLTLSVGTTETSGATYFDDLTVEQTGGMIVQEQHQYAYGSPLVGLNYAVGNKRYRYGYQGQYAEKDAETGFENFELRLYNSRIGRWTSYDPEGEFNSPYVGMGNNPVSNIDPDGGCTKCPYWTGFGTRKVAQSAGSTGAKSVVTTAARATSKTSLNIAGNALRAGVRATTAVAKADAIKSPRLLDPILYAKSRAMYRHWLTLGTVEPSYALEAILIPMLAEARVASLASMAKGGTTVIGGDIATVVNAKYLLPEEGVHQLVLHGNVKGWAFERLGSGGIITELSPNTIAKALLRDGYAPGTPIRLVSCHAGKLDYGMAFQISRLLRTTVIAPTDEVGVEFGGAFFHVNKGYWRTFNYTPTIK